MFIKRNYKGSDKLSTGKIFAFYLTTKGGEFRIVEELLQCNKKKIGNSDF